MHQEFSPGQILVAGYNHYPGCCRIYCTVGDAAIISIQLSHNDRRMAVIALLFSKPIICVRIPDTLRLGWTRDVTVIYHRQKPPELLIDLSQLHHNKGLSCYCFKYKISSQQSSHKSFDLGPPEAGVNDKY